LAVPRPREGGLWWGGAKFLPTPYYSQRRVCVSLSAFSSRKWYDRSSHELTLLVSSCVDNVLVTIAPS